MSIDDFKGPLRDVYVRNGQFVTVGDKIIQPKLAETLTVIAENGPGAFYEGEIASSIVNAVSVLVTLFGTGNMGPFVRGGNSE